MWRLNQGFAVNILLKIFLTEAFLFSATILLGISVALRLDHLVAHASDGVSTPMTVGVILFYVLVATLLVLFFLKKGAGLFLRFLLLFSVFVGGWITLIPFLGEYALLFLLLLLFLLIKKPLVVVHNTCIIIAIAGAGAVVGISLTPLIVIVLAAILSVYDVIAVYKTKHMVKMAEGMVKSKSILGIVIPFQIKDLFLDLKKTDVQGRFMILGGGDIMIPLLLCVAFLSQGVVYSLVIFAFSLMGLAFSFILFISPETKRPIPALPPIVFMLTFGYIILEVFNHVASFSPVA